MKIEHLLTLDTAATYAKTVRLQNLALSPDEKHLYVGDFGTKKTHVWDTASGGLVKTIPVKLEDCPTIAISPDGRLLGVGGSSGAVWDIDAGKAMVKLAKFSQHIAFSADSTQVAATDGKKMQIWSTETGEVVHKVKLPRKGVGVIAFLPATSLWVVETRDEEWSYAENRMATLAELRAINAKTGKATGQATETVAVTSDIVATSLGLLARRIPQINAKSGLTRGGPADVWDAGLDGHAQIATPTEPPTMSFRGVAPLADGSAVSLELLGDDPSKSPTEDRRVVRCWNLAKRSVDQAELDPSCFGMPIKMAAGPNGMLAFLSDAGVNLGRLVRS